MSVPERSDRREADQSAPPARSEPEQQSSMSYQQASPTEPGAVPFVGPSSMERSEQVSPASDQRVRTERLLDEHYQVVFRYAYRLTGCAASAEDVTQEVFLRAYRSVHQLREQAAARGWLMTITRNEFARWCRKSAPGRSLESEGGDFPAAEVEPALDRCEWVQQALEELPQEFRQVLLMYYFEESSYAKIAQDLQIPIGTVMSRLNRGKGHLKAALDKAGEPRSPDRSP